MASLHVSEQLLGEELMKSALKCFSGLVGSLAFVVAAFILLSGCARQPVEAPPMTPPSVSVSYPV
jgi:hypothetical protein